MGGVSHAGYSLEKSRRPTLRSGACPLPTSKSDYNGQGTTRSLECACASSFQHSARSTCSMRSTSGQPRRKSLSDAPLFLRRRTASPPASQLCGATGSQPSGPLGSRTCASHIFMQCRSEYLQPKQSQRNCRLHARFLSFKITCSSHWVSDFRPRPRVGKTISP